MRITVLYIDIRDSTSYYAGHLVNNEMSLLRWDAMNHVYLQLLYTTEVMKEFTVPLCKV